MASPYVSLYIPRRQAELIEKLLLRECEGKAESSRYHAALNSVQKAMRVNA